MLKKVAVPFSEAENRLCPPFCHLTIFFEMRSGSSRTSSEQPLQNDDIQTICTFFCTERATKKEPFEKAPLCG
mgnify:FL=1